MKKKQKKIKFEKRKFYIASVIIPLVVVAITVFGPKLYEKIIYSERPSFSIKNTFVREISKIIIVADNKSANKNQELNIEYDGLLLDKSAIPIPNTKPQEWILTLFDKKIPNESLMNGIHKLRISFGTFSESKYFNIIISDNAPIPNSTKTIFGHNFKLEKIIVDNPVDFVKALKSNTHIILKSGKYNLSEATNIVSEYINWVKVHDGYEMHIDNIKNLIIEGEKNAEIVVEPRYSFVLNFNESHLISINNLIIGHTEGGFCSGGVLQFKNSSQIFIDNTELYGSGTIGIEYSNVRQFYMKASTIRDCTYGLLSIRKSNDINFIQTTFMNTGKYKLISISDNTKNVLFDNCRFLGNWSTFGNLLFSGYEYPENIQIKNTFFKGNKVKYFTNIEELYTTNCTFENNSFEQYTNENKYKTLEEVSENLIINLFKKKYAEYLGCFMNYNDIKSELKDHSKEDILKNPLKVEEFYNEFNDRVLMLTKSLEKELLKNGIKNCEFIGIDKSKVYYENGKREGIVKIFFSTNRSKIKYYSINGFCRNVRGRWKYEIIFSNLTISNEKREDIPKLFN